ncbi:MAG: hypothetical protein OEV08_11320 [Nitrospira sp.]|nr:hypothetical protein [Nitrospira sp.]
MSTFGSADPAVLQEAARVLEEEVKLAARPQTYVLIDLAANVISIKGRGLELHRISIEHWSASHLSKFDALYQLRERPAVNRRKIDPAAVAGQEPISLTDMPETYTLQLNPALTILVFPSTERSVWRGTLLRSQYWWRRLSAWGHALLAGEGASSDLSLDLTVSLDHAQSLAWTVTDSMAFLIRRPIMP